MESKPNIEWRTLEHAYYEKTGDWYWIVGIVGLTVSVLAFLFGNGLFALLMLVATITVLIHAARVPTEVTVSLQGNGVRVGSNFYPYTSLTAFSLDEESAPPVLVLDSKAFLVPNIHIFIEEAKVGSIRDFLLDHMNEKYHVPSVVEALVHYLGF